MKHASKLWLGFFTVSLAVMNGCGSSSNDYNKTGIKIVNSDKTGTGTVSSNLTADLETYCKEACEKVVACKLEGCES